MSPTDPRLDHAEAIALDRLLAIARDSDSDHEARLAAVAIFSIRGQCAKPAADDSHAPPGPCPVSSPSPAPARPAALQPLTRAELAELTRHLPAVKPQRFLNKHSPAYWRQVLDRHRAAATGPPAQAA